MAYSDSDDDITAANNNSARRIDIDKLTNTERMKIAIRLAKQFRRYNYPDVCSTAFLKPFINQLRIDGFTEEEIRFAVIRAYSKRIKKYECKEQYELRPTRV
jgi:hypothetical protein